MALFAAMSWFGRDEGLPDDPLGRETALLPTVVAWVQPDKAEAASTTALAKALRSDASPETTSALDIIQVAAVPSDNKPQKATLVLASASEPDPKIEAEPEPELLYVSGSRVNVRGGPSTSYGVIASLTYGIAVEDMGDASDGWRAIRLMDTGERGYMAGRFLTAEVQ